MIDNRKLIIIISCSVLFFGLFGVGLYFLLRSGGGADSEFYASVLENDGVTGSQAGNHDTRRQNILKLAASYLKAGEFDRALNLIDGLLIDNHDDEDALKLQREILDQNRRSETDELIAAQRRFLEEQRQNTAAFNTQRAVSDSMAAADAEAAAERRAAAEAEAARKKAQDEELAKVSRELQEKMRKVNDLVSDGKAKLASGDFSGAEKKFAEVRGVMPEGENRFESQKLAEIAEAYYDYNSRNSDSANGREAAVKAGNYANESAAKDPTQPLPHYVLGKLARDSRQNDKAIAEFKEATRLDSHNFIYFHDLGRSLFSVRRYLEAKDSFQSVVSINSNFEPGWYNLGGTLRMLNRHEEALSAYRQAVAVKADYVPAHREIGRLLQSAGDYKGAIDAFSKALHYIPNDYSLLCEIGATYSQAGNFQQAESFFIKAVHINPADAQTNYNMAVVKLELKKYNEAISFAKTAVDNSPSNAVYIYTLGLACESAGHDKASKDAAITAYKKAAALDPKYIRPRINLGNIYISTGNLNEAASYLNEVYGIEPNNFEVNNNLGAVYARQENWTYSIIHYERALSAKPNDTTVRLNLSRAYAGAGDFEKAQNAYQTLLHISPDNWDAMYELGMTCLSLGKNDDAKRYLQDLIKRNPNYDGKAEAERILRTL
jgi:tetratricopeptide (TPR) repeat protein